MGEYRQANVGDSVEFEYGDCTHGLRAANVK
jgi:hypothetical protein